MKGLVNTMSCKPPAALKLCNIPLEDRSHSEDHWRIVYQGGLRPGLAGVTLLHVLNDPEGFPCCPSSHGDMVLRGGTGGERVHGRGVA